MRKLPKRERGYYIVINGFNKEGKPISTRVRPGELYLTVKEKTKKYPNPHVWPAKYKLLQEEKKKQAEEKTEKVLDSAPVV